MKVKTNLLFAKVVGEEKSFVKKLLTAWKLAIREAVKQRIKQGPKDVGLKK